MGEQNGIDDENEEEKAESIEEDTESKKVNGVDFAVKAFTSDKGSEMGSGEMLARRDGPK